MRELVSFALSVALRWLAGDDVPLVYNENILMGEKEIKVDGYNNILIDIF